MDDYTTGLVGFVFFSDTITSGFVLPGIFPFKVALQISLTARSLQQGRPYPKLNSASLASTMMHFWLSSEGKNGSMSYRGLWSSQS